MELTGFHHLTAVTAQVRDNHRFYTETLGLRLVKRSVNQDDVSAYHLFYADGAGTPGTDITFFDWRVPPERRGNRSISRTGLMVEGPESVDWWRQRLDGLAATAEPVLRDGRLTLDFEDPEGQRLAIVDASGSDFDSVPWERSLVPARHQIRGLGPITITVPELEPTDLVLTRLLGMRRSRSYPSPESADETVHVFEMGRGGAGAELHVEVRPALAPGRPGAGGVHHVAFRVPDDDYDEWLERLDRAGVPNSGQVDRYWFRSLYFREPNGILFEIATDGPGFAVDEDPEALGETVVLPPFLEPRRDRIVANLPPID
ncbi:MAG TPA: ring-cleaving dioxygenase [Trueperaceae bacterium]